MCIEDRFYVQAYMRHSKIKLQSVFPIFRYETFEPRRSYKIVEDYSISSKEVLAAAQSDKAKICFQDEDTYTVDIAQALPTVDKIPQGIYFVIPKEELDSWGT